MEFEGDLAGHSLSRTSSRRRRAYVRAVNIPAAGVVGARSGDAQAAP